jgi:CheY-like chemotaxis protein
MKILVIDDSAVIRTKLRKILASCGYAVVDASDGEEDLTRSSGSSSRLFSGLGHLLSDDLPTL